MTYESLSWWHESAGDDLTPRPTLPGSTDVDVAIVGAGLTGLWTAYYLIERDPSLRIAVLEKDIAGFGASGRNGGWCSALFPQSRDKLAKLPGSSRSAANAMVAEMRHTVAEVARVVEAEGIDCDLHMGGTLVFARTDTQLARAKADVADAYAWGDTEDDIRLLDADEATKMAAASNVHGATFTPHCARIHPAKLVRGLARVVEARGVTIYERTEVSAIQPRRVLTSQGTVNAAYVVRATEGFTPALDGMKRHVIPVYSLIVATEPLPAAIWDQIGLEDSPTFSDFRHLIIYAQRTADDRIVFGGRGAPYHFASRIDGRFDRVERVFAELRETLVELFPRGGRSCLHARLGRSARHHPRLDGQCRHESKDGTRLGGRLRRRRGQHDQSGRAEPHGPDHRDRQRSRPIALGQPSIAVMGTRTSAMVGHQRRPQGDGCRRPRGTTDQAGEHPGATHVPAGRWPLTARPARRDGSAVRG